MKSILWTLALLGASSSWAQQYITTDRDVLEFLPLPESRYQVFGDIAILSSMGEEQREELTHLLHEKSGRCGGYFVHESLKAAKEDVALMERAQKLSQWSFTDYSIDQRARIESWLPQITPLRIQASIEKLSSFHNRYYESQTGVASQKWLLEKWQGLLAGRKDARVYYFEHESWAQPSVIAEIKGSTYPDEVVVLGGHADSISGYFRKKHNHAPGADDNASGIATITEVLEVLVHNQYRPQRTILLMGYAAEEVGLRGSDEIARHFRRQGVQVKGKMQLDMTNFKGSKEDIVLISDYTNKAQNQFVSQLIDEYVQVPWGWTSCGYACSDHASWHKQGFPASFPFEAHKSDMNRKIHTDQDTLEQSGGDAQHAQNFAKLALSFVVELAK